MPMDIMGENRGYTPVSGGGGGGGLIMQLTSFGANTGGGGLWEVTPSPPTSEADLLTINITSVISDASYDGTLEFNFDASGSPTGDLFWNLDTTLFGAPSAEWAASITSSDPTSPGSAVLRIEFLNVDAFEQGLKVGLLVDDGVGGPVAMYITVNHFESP